MLDSTRSRKKFWKLVGGGHSEFSERRGPEKWHPERQKVKGHDPPTNEMCVTAEAGVTQMAGTPAKATHDCGQRKKYGDVSMRLFLPPFVSCRTRLMKARIQ